MMKHIILRISGLLLSFFALSGCSSSGGGNESSDSLHAEVLPETDLTSEATAYADSMLNCLTLEQRVGQCFMPSIYSRGDNATLRHLQSYISDFHVGGIVLLKGDVRSAAILSDISRKSEVPLFIAMDAEWGLGMRLEDAPGFPRNGNIGDKADEELLFEYGSEVARECRRIGINMVLGPVVDVVENPGGVIGNRSFGGDPIRVAELGTAYARGLENGRVISVAKHFPGHGSPVADSHKSLPVIERSLHQLDSVDLYPFRHYIEHGLSGIMVGHLAVPAVDPQSLPAAVSAPVIQDLLREELGFRGLVLTDALNMGGVKGYGALSAILAGADIVISPAHTGVEIRDVIDGVQKGLIPVEVINERCRRILFYKYLVRNCNPGVIMEGIKEDVTFGTDSLRRRLEQ